MIIGNIIMGADKITKIGDNCHEASLERDNVLFFHEIYLKILSFLLNIQSFAII